METQQLRALNEEGRQVYRQWLEELRQNPALPVPPLLSDPAYSYAPVADLDLPSGPFATKLELATALLPLVQHIEARRVAEARWPGIWDGLALAYFDEICPSTGGGTRKVGEIERYIWDPRHIRFYKHRIAATLTLFRVHREHSVVFLCGGPSVLSDYEIQICSRQEWMSCKAVGNICCDLYWDPIKKLTKRGGMSKTRPGALFHLVRVIQHLERTYDLQGMTGDGLALLLPIAFQPWLPPKELFPFSGSPVNVLKEQADKYTSRIAELPRTIQASAETRCDPAYRFSSLQVGAEYTRDDLATLWGYESFHAIARGVVTPKDSNAIVLFATENVEPTEQAPYVNYRSGNTLTWDGPDDHFAEQRIIDSTYSNDRIHVFYREQHRSAFEYMGVAELLEFEINQNRSSRFTFKLPNALVRSS